MRAPYFMLVFSMVIFATTGVSESGEEGGDLWNKISYSSSQSSVGLGVGFLSDGSRISPRWGCQPGRGATYQISPKIA